MNNRHCQCILYCQPGGYNGLAPSGAAEFNFVKIKKRPRNAVTTPTDRAYWESFGNFYIYTKSVRRVTSSFFYHKNFGGYGRGWSRSFWATFKVYQRNFIVVWWYMSSTINLDQKIKPKSRHCHASCMRHRAAITMTFAKLEFCSPPADHRKRRPYDLYYSPWIFFTCKETTSVHSRLKVTPSSEGEGRTFIRSFDY